MIIKPKVRGFICTTAHPVGCAQNVAEQIDFAAAQPAIKGPSRVLVIGASTGFGLASRIVSAFSAGAATIGVFFERPASDNRTATAGWYNTAAFEKAAQTAGLYAKSINGDAFSDEIKQQTIELIRQELGTVDMIVYSLASPRRTHPQTGETFSSVLKPIGNSFRNKTVDVQSGKISEIVIDPATEEEIRQTVAVMGGEDWELWINALDQAGVLAASATTVAYSYIGPELTHAVYREGTIGRAKDDLEATARRLDEKLRTRGLRAFVSVNKGLVTQSSSAIPVVPLYISLLFKEMKEAGIHEGCIEQMHRLFAERLYSGSPTPVDEAGRIRIDDREMRADIQSAVSALWEQVDTHNLESISDVQGYRSEFLRLFGFGLPGVDYEADIDPDVAIPSI